MAKGVARTPQLQALHVVAVRYAMQAVPLLCGDNNQYL